MVEHKWLLFDYCFTFVVFQHMRAYGLTDDVDDSDGHDLSLSRSDHKHQVRICWLIPAQPDVYYRSHLLNRMIPIIADRPVRAP